MLEILKKVPEKREAQEILVLIKETDARYSFFKEFLSNFTTKEKFNFFHNLRYEYHGKNSVIYQYSDASNKLYILMKGKINVFIEDSTPGSACEDSLH